MADPLKSGDFCRWDIHRWKHKWTILWWALERSILRLLPGELRSSCNFYSGPFLSNLTSYLPCCLQMVPILNLVLRISAPRHRIKSFLILALLVTIETYWCREELIGHSGHLSSVMFWRSYNCGVIILSHFWYGHALFLSQAPNCTCLLWMVDVVQQLSVKFAIFFFFFLSMGHELLEHFLTKFHNFAGQPLFAPESDMHQLKGKRN